MQIGQEASLQQAIAEVAKLMVPWAMLPSWIFKYPNAEMKRVDYVFNHFQNTMKEKIAARKSEIAGGDFAMKIKQKDLFTRILQANTGDGTTTLDDDEVLGNTFAFMFAGHETTASSMAITLALLALHPKEQAWAYDAVAQATQNGDPLFADYNTLLPVQACFYEAVRLYPPGYVAIRESSRDDIFTIPGVQHGKQSQVCVPNGTLVIVDMIGANRNSRHFPSPSEFKPSRWEGSTESFLGFSVGPRACLGRKFATVEAVCFLALMLRDWKVEPLLSDGETQSEWKKRFLDVQLGATLTVQSVPLKVTRRTRK